MGKTLLYPYLFYSCLFFMAFLSVGLFLLLPKLDLVKLTVTMRVLTYEEVSSRTSSFYYKNNFLAESTGLSVLPGIQLFEPDSQEWAAESGKRTMVDLGT